MVNSPAFTGRSSPSRDDSPAQARLLRLRGDLVRTTRSFDANLEEPGARARPRAPHRPLTRLGFEVKYGEAMDLSVSSVDTGMAQATPVAQWNSWEARKVWHGTGEPLPIRPGDRICAVNGEQDDDAMVDALLSAASMADPKPVSLRIERPNSAVMERSSPARQTASAGDASPSRPPALSLRASSAPRRRMSGLESSESNSQLIQAAFSGFRPPRIPTAWMPSKPSRSKSRPQSRDEEASTRSPSNSTSTSRACSALPSSRSSSVCIGDVEEQSAFVALVGIKSRSASPQLPIAGRLSAARDVARRAFPRRGSRVAPFHG